MKLHCYNAWFFLKGTLALVGFKVGKRLKRGLDRLVEVRLSWVSYRAIDSSTLKSTWSTSVNLTDQSFLEST